MPASASLPDPVTFPRPPAAGGARLPFVAALAALVGAGAGVAAYALYALITLVSNLVFFRDWSLVHHRLTEHTLGAWVVVVPALGGLVVGLMAKYGSAKIRGHGIPEAMEAVLFNRSRIAPRVALLKPLSVAVAIGTGGPFGAEGPIIQTGGALGSILGQLLQLTSAERKSLLAAGAAAGMAATFGTPLAAVIVAIELLLFEYRPRSFIPLVIASAVATAVRFVLFGPGAMFAVGTMDFGLPGSALWWLPLGLLCGLMATGFSRALYWVEDQFERLPCDELWWPAIGGLGLGLVGWAVPRVLGVGYETISDLLNARFALAALLVIMAAKALALLVSLGSGTSGGLLAPMFTIGAALGGGYAEIVNGLVPSAHLSPGACALVAMAAVFGAAARAPFALIVFAFELTRNYDAILPLMLVVAIAHGLALRYMPNSIMTEKLARRGLRVHQEYAVDDLERTSVGAVMAPAPAGVPVGTTVSEIVARIEAREPALIRHHALLLVDGDGRLEGILTRGDLVRACAADPAGGQTVREAGTMRPEVAFPDESLGAAVDRMLRRDCGRLPVVARDDPGRIVGYLGRAAVLHARRQRLHDDHVAEAGWLKTTVRSRPS